MLQNLTISLRRVKVVRQAWNSKPQEYDDLTPGILFRLLFKYNVIENGCASTRITIVGEHMRLARSMSCTAWLYATPFLKRKEEILSVS